MIHLSLCVAIATRRAWDDGRMDRAWDFRALADAGIPITLGTDWPVWPSPDIMVNLRTAIDGLGSRSLSRQEAFHAYTEAAASCLGHNQQTGCLRNGCLADMVVLDQDPFVVDQADIATISIDQVWLGGSQVH